MLPNDAALHNNSTGQNQAKNCSKNVQKLMTWNRALQHHIVLS
jgi:hypothetical protein